MHVQTRIVTQYQVRCLRPATGSLAHRTSKHPHIGTLTSGPIPTLSYITNTRIQFAHSNPLMVFASPISQPCLVFVPRALSRVKFLFRAFELSFSLSLWKLSRKLVNFADLRRRLVRDRGTE